MLKPFDSRNYRIYFAGQMVSTIGTMMTQTASLWLVYKLTHSALLIGAVAFAAQIPSLLLGPIAGVLIDRIDRYRVLLATQFLSLLQSFFLAYLTFTGRIDFLDLILLNFFQGVVNVFEQTTRQALIVPLIERRENLASAIGLNVTTIHVAKLAGPAIAGIVIARYGAGFCFFLDGVSFLAILGALAVIRLPRHVAPHAPRHPWHELREGLSQAYHFGPIRALVINLSLISFSFASIGTLAPVFARDIFHGDARTLGFLMASAAFGSLLSSLYLSARETVRGLGRLISGGGALLGGGLILLGLPTSMTVAILFLALAGAGAALVVASTNTLLQTLVEDGRRGRVMGLFTMGFAGMVPIGSLATGAIANQIGAKSAIVLAGILALGSAVYFRLQLSQFRAEAAPVIRKFHPQLLPLEPEPKAG